MATLSDVAALAGVSVSAVSRVLSNAPATRVSDDTRERIHAAAKTLDYRPNFAGRALKTSRSQVIALVVPDLTNAIFTELMRGVEDAAIARDYMVLLGRAEDMQPGGAMIERLIGEGRVDGLLVQLAEDVTSADVDRLMAGRAPVVLINSVEAGHPGSVVLDDERAARLGTEHLLKLGHRRIGLITGVPESFSGQRRADGFRQAMAAASIDVDEALITRLGYEPRAGREAFRTLVTADDAPTAILVANVNAAIGALAEARSLGISVPDDVSVVALHDAWTAENTWPPLTTVRMPLYELGRRAAEAVFARMSGGAVSDVTVADVEPELIERESTASL